MVIPGVIYVKILIWFSFRPGAYQFDRIPNSILHQICEFRITGISPTEAARRKAVYLSTRLHIFFRWINRIFQMFLFLVSRMETQNKSLTSKKVVCCLCNLWVYFAWPLLAKCSFMKLARSDVSNVIFIFFLSLSISLYKDPAV